MLGERRAECYKGRRPREIGMNAPIIPSEARNSASS